VALRPINSLSRKLRSASARCIFKRVFLQLSGQVGSY
jgi:hypothetical protein